MGRLDLAVARPLGVEVYVGDGSGTFGTPIVSPGVAFAFAAAADLNEDGALDLIAPNGVAFGRGDGTFDLTPAVGVPTQPRGMLRADFNGDGIPDVILAGYVAGITMLPGIAGGSFGPATALSSKDTNSLASADFNRDGRLDLAAGSAQGIEIRLGLPGGGLSPPTLLPFSGAASLAAGDIRETG